MAGKRNIEWLRDELPGLVAKGVLTEDAATRLREHYSDAAAAQEGRNWIGIIFSVLGALLVGAGIILLLAYNWTAIPRSLRAVLAFIPLLVGQYGAGRVIWKWRDEIAPREGWGIFLCLSVGACIALISQTYHLGGEFDTFLLVWMLLCLPLAHLLRAVVPALLCLAGFTSWAVLWKVDGGSGLWLWLLFAAVLAHSLDVLGERGGSQRSVILVFASSVVLLIATGLSLGEKAPQMAWMTTYMGLLSLMYVGGGLMRESYLRGSRNPLRFIGALGVIGISLALTFGPVWEEMSLGWLGIFDEEAQMAGWIASCGFTLAALVVWVLAFRAKYRDLCWLGAAPLVMIVGFSVSHTAAGVLFNVYLFAAGLAGIVIGVRERRLGRVNTGMIVLLLVITFRFFDSDIGFVGKGIAFILLGAAFLTANVKLSRRFRGVPV